MSAGWQEGGTCIRHTVSAGHELDKAAGWNVRKMGLFKREYLQKGVPGEGSMRGWNRQAVNWPSLTRTAGCQSSLALPALFLSSVVLPALFPVIDKAAIHTGRSSVIRRPAGACHHSRQLPLPEWSCAYSILDFPDALPISSRSQPLGRHLDLNLYPTPLIWQEAPSPALGTNLLSTSQDNGSSLNLGTN